MVKKAKAKTAAKKKAPAKRKTTAKKKKVNLIRSEPLRASRRLQGQRDDIG